MGISITGCELTNIQIQSPIFGDYLGTITVNGTFKVSEDAPLINDTVENPDWNPTIPEEPSVDIGAETTINPIEDCDCGDNDDECWEKCLSNHNLQLDLWLFLLLYLLRAPPC